MSSEEKARIEQLRRDTPGTASVSHLNNAGAALQAKPVIEAQKSFIDLESRIGGYEACKAEPAALDRPYKAIAELINCDPAEIAVVQSATQAWTQVFYGIQFRTGDRVLTSVAEYGSNYLAFLQTAKLKGVQIEVIPETADGDISLPDLERLINEGERLPALIAITHIPTNSGRVYDAAAVGEIATHFGIPYLLDACQSIGQMPVDVKAIGCDWLSATGRKFLRGPRGIGFLYASEGAMQWAEPAVIDMQGASWVSRNDYALVASAKRYEQYERSMAAQVGLGVAVEYALSQGLDWIWERNQRLAGKLRVDLSKLAGVRVHDHGKQLCSIVSFSKEGVDAQTAASALAAEGINVHPSSITSTRLDFEARKLPEAVVRASVHYYNTEEELEGVVKAVARLSPTQGRREFTATGLLLGGLFRSR